MYETYSRLVSNDCLDNLQEVKGLQFERIRHGGELKLGHFVHGSHDFNAASQQRLVELFVVQQRGKVDRIVVSLQAGLFRSQDLFEDFVIQFNGDLFTSLAVVGERNQF
jgi:hypothetical protein